MSNYYKLNNGWIDLLSFTNFKPTHKIIKNISHILNQISKKLFYSMLRMPK